MAAPAVIPRKHSQMLKAPNATAVNPAPTVNGGVKADSHPIHPEREVELVNHCFVDVERFMGRLQQTAEAQSILRQQSKKKSRRKNSKKEPEDGLLTQKASPPSEQEFVDIFQKIKYSICLLDRLKTEISQPTSEELVHHVFIPLDLMVKTTGGPELAATVSSPALTSGAISLLHHNLTGQEKALWSSLGPYWTLPYSQLSETVPHYTPVFLDGWQPNTTDAFGQPIEDPIESQHKHEALIQTKQVIDQARLALPQEHERMEDSMPPQDRMYRCSYDFVARNSSELSVLHGETLEVIESSKRWWKCRNNYNEVGFVPHNILEPINHSEVDSSNVVMRNQSMKAPLSPPKGGRFSYAAPNPLGDNALHPDSRPHSMPPMTDEGDRVMMMNDELIQRLANGRPASIRPVVINKANETSVPLDYNSSPNEVQEWLRGKGFSDYTVRSLGVLTGAQLFSLNKEELRAVSPDEGARVYSQIMVQKSLLEDLKRATELEAIMKKQKMKVDLKAEDGEF